jgi:hypothetical protein
MADDDARAPAGPARPAAHASSEVVALAVLAGALVLFTVVALLSWLPTFHPVSFTVVMLTALAAPTLALVVTRAQVRRRATDLSTLNLDAYVGTGAVVALVAFPSLGDSVVPGPVGVMCLGFLAVGVLRRESYLAATALAAFLATSPADLAGPLRADNLTAPAQLGTLVVATAVVAGIAVWRSRISTPAATVTELRVSEPA